MSETSSLQQKIKSILIENNIFFEENNRKIIYPMELDFFLPEHNVAIEVNGNYWHSELSGEKDSKYHINKSKLCNAKGIRLVHVFEDEILLKPDVVSGEILNILNLSKNSVNAIDCEVRTVKFDEYKEFLNKNHINGFLIGKFNYGLYYNGRLVFFMNFSNKKTQEGGGFELLSYCNKIGFDVIGGFEVLLNHFIHDNNPKNIFSFVDCRWFGIDPNKVVFSKNGFEFVSMVSPSYFYIFRSDYLNRISRFSLTKPTMLRENVEFTKEQTEFEMAQELGYDRIWDCGSLKFQMKLK